VTWSSSNASVAIVSSGGCVTVKAMDDATVIITATTVNNLQATYSIRPLIRGNDLATKNQIALGKRIIGITTIIPDK